MNKLFELVRDSSPLCVGLDPDIDKMQIDYDFDSQDITYIYDRFCSNILKSLKSVVKIVKFQSAYFEAVPNGLTTLKHLISDAKTLGYYTILDAKRSDISTTALAYAKAAFDIYDVDAMTILPFMGEKSIRTFVDYARSKDRQIFVVLYPTETSIYAGLSLTVINSIQRMGDENINNGYGDVGVVISGLNPNFIELHRKIAPRVFFLIPGLGKQGGKIEDQVVAFNNKNGAILNYSRNIIYADDPLKATNGILADIKQLVK